MDGSRCPRCEFKYGLEGGSADGWACRHCGWAGQNILNLEGDDMGTSIPWDVVTLRIKAAKQVESETVRVFVSGNLLAGGDDTARTKAVLAEALSKVIDAPWSLITARRGEDPSGMERVSVGASVRVKEHLTAGLVERLKRASRAGLQLRLDGISNRPPASEMEKAVGGLRQEVYQKARAEADRLNEFLPTEEGKWRVAHIEFNESGQDDDRPRPIRDHASVRYMRAPASEGGETEPDLPTTTRAVLEAKVQLKRLSVAAPQGGFFGGQ